jgi:hypothetical protein
MCKDNIAAYDRRISPHRESSRMASSGPSIGASAFMVGRRSAGKDLMGRFLLTRLRYEA